MMDRPSGLSDETSAAMDAAAAPEPSIVWPAGHVRVLPADWPPQTFWGMAFANVRLKHVSGEAVGGIISALRFVDDPPPRTPQEEMRAFLEQWWESGCSAREDHWHAQWAAGDWLDERLPWERWSTGLGIHPIE